MRKIMLWWHCKMYLHNHRKLQAMRKNNASLNEKSKYIDRSTHHWYKIYLMGYFINYYELAIYDKLTLSSSAEERVSRMRALMRERRAW